jgi:hypothetical protein
MPLFVEDREEHAVKLKQEGIRVDHIYDPPFPRYIPPELFVNHVKDEAACRRWSRDVLPIDVHDIEGACTYLLKASPPVGGRRRAED